MTQTAIVHFEPRHSANEDGENRGDATPTFKLETNDSRKGTVGISFFTGPQRTDPPK